MKKTIFSIIIALNATLNLYPQNLTQTVRGKISDSESQSPVAGVTIYIADIKPDIFTISNADGDFRLENVPVGRITIRTDFIGYNPAEIRDIENKSGKETVINISISEKVEELGEIVISARKDIVSNETATVSARTFTVDETERYAGTWLDPARMASNYAGVMSAGDQRNDIIIRGNSPLGLLWRLEGVNIPNPNHFGTLGTTGGPISILNNNLLANSDFYTGAFPAEYGNAVSGVFDLKLRNGNNENYEFTAQAGMNGLEFGAEGPFTKKSKASFLLNYRYSTLAVFEFLDINFGVSGVPEFQDLSYKINIPVKKLGTFTFFGVGGISKIEVFYDDRKSTDWTFGHDKLNFKFSSAMGATGISHFARINKNSFVKTVFALTGNSSSAQADSAGTEELKVYYGDNSSEYKYVLSSKYTGKINKKNTIYAGINLDMYKVNYKDSVLMPDNSYLALLDAGGENMNLLAAWTQIKHKFTDEISFTGGIYFHEFTLNKHFSFEPRIGFSWNFKPKHSLNFGAGILSQLQPRLFYYQETNINDSIYYTNKNLDFTKSAQAVLSYDYLINKNLRLKTEIYYQYLSKIPVETNPSYFSMVNYGTSFFEVRNDSLINNGSAQNYGFELTVEKFLSKNFYFLITSSIFESNYKGSDNIKRNTIYNGRYVLNFLAGYTFKLGKHKSLNLDFKTVQAGGKHFIPVDFEASEIAGREILNYYNAYEAQYPDYFRIDGRLGFKSNYKKFNVEAAFDLQNITNHKNILLETYDEESDSIVYDYQLGLFYVFFIRFQF